MRASSNIRAWAPEILDISYQYDFRSSAEMKPLVTKSSPTPSLLRSPNWAPHAHPASATTGSATLVNFPRSAS